MVHWRDHPRWDKCIYVGVSPRQLLSGRAWPRSLASYSTGRRSQAQLVAPPGLHGEAQSNLQWTTQELLYAVPAARADWSQAPPGFDHLLEHQLVSEVGIPFFSLWCGRSRSKARSLHENKLLSRKLQHGHRWSHENRQIMLTKHKTPQTKGKTQIPQPDLRLTFTRTAKQTAKGARAQQKHPQKICQLFPRIEPLR